MSQLKPGELEEQQKVGNGQDDRNQPPIANIVDNRVVGSDERAVLQENIDNKKFVKPAPAAEKTTISGLVKDSQIIKSEKRGGPIVTKLDVGVQPIEDEAMDTSSPGQLSTPVITHGYKRHAPEGPQSSEPPQKMPNLATDDGETAPTPYRRARRRHMPIKPLTVFKCGFKEMGASNDGNKFLLYGLQVDVGKATCMASKMNDFDAWCRFLATKIFKINAHIKLFLSPALGPLIQQLKHSMCKLVSGPQPVVLTPVDGDMICEDLSVFSHSVSDLVVANPKFAKTWCTDMSVIEDCYERVKLSGQPAKEFGILTKAKPRIVRSLMPVDRTVEQTRKETVDVPLNTAKKDCAEGQAKIGDKTAPTEKNNE